MSLQNPACHQSYLAAIGTFGIDMSRTAASSVRGNAVAAPVERAAGLAGPIVPRVICSALNDDVGVFSKVAHLS
jgi:hypothetical protein